MNIFTLPNCISFLCPVTVLRLQPEKRGKCEKEEGFLIAPVLVDLSAELLLVPSCTFISAIRRLWLEQPGGGQGEGEPF